MTATISLGPLIITYVALSALIPDPGHPRQHSARQIKQIARSIEAFGFVVPLLIDCYNRIVGGLGRYLAAQLLGMDVVPVIRLEHLTGTQLRAFRIADNRLSDLSSWNDRLLAETLKDLSELDLDFSLEVTGFTMGEIDVRIEGLSVIENDASDPRDQIPPPANHSVVSKPGDLWQLGRHWVVCGSALSDEAFHALLGSKRAQMVFTDPPYNVPIQGHVSVKSRLRHREFAMAVGEMDRVAFTSFLKQSCALMAQYSIDGCIHFICMDWRHVGELLEAGSPAYGEPKCICVWVKNNGGMGSLYRSEHEFVFVFKSGTASHRNNVQLGRYGRNRTTVWRYPCANTFSRQSDEGYLAALHPTVKPLAMVADAMLDCSARGDLVLDPFLGSGTTVIAAERVGRCCYGMEMDPLYVDTIIRRWQAYTGHQAVHAASGKNFDDLISDAEMHHE